MRVMVVGAGALGMLFCGKVALVQGSAEITLVTHSMAQKELIVQDGIEVADQMQVSVSYPQSLAIERVVEFMADQEDLRTGWIFLTVKQQHIDSQLIGTIAAIMDRQPSLKLLLFQNGMGHAEKFSSHISPTRIFLAITTEGALKVSGNRVIHTGKGTTILGSITEDQNYDETVLFAMAELLRDAGFSCLLSKSTDSIVWNKLLINAIINPLTAIWRIRNGELLVSPERLEWMRALLDEGISVATAIGVNVADDLWDQLLNVCRMTAKNSSSMLQDVLAGRPTELAWINGEIVRIAHGKGIAVLNHEKVCDLMKLRPGSCDS